MSGLGSNPTTAMYEAESLDEEDFAIPEEESSKQNGD